VLCTGNDEGPRLAYSRNEKDRGAMRNCDRRESAFDGKMGGGIVPSVPTSSSTVSGGKAFFYSHPQKAS